MHKPFVPLFSRAALIRALAAAPLALTVACAPAAPPPAAGVSAAPSAAASTAPSAAASAAASTVPSQAPSAAPSAPVPAATDATHTDAGHAAAVAEGNAEACEHMAEGPAEVKQANLASMSRERARVTAEHRRWDVQLEPNAGKNEGYVIFENDAAGGFHFALGADVPFKLMQDGKAVAFHETIKAGLGCDAVKVIYETHLGIGPVELHFGPTEAKAVSLVLEKHEGEEDHEH